MHACGQYVYPPRQDDEEPDLPAAIVVRLEESLVGCEWMLDEWARLQSVLEKRQPWISSDKLKATRLLGRQPFDAIDDGDVALVFLASHRIRPRHSEWAWEILSEMDAQNHRRFRDERGRPGAGVADAGQRHGGALHSWR